MMLSVVLLSGDVPGATKNPTPISFSLDPRGMISDGNGSLWAALYDTGELAHVDVNTHTLTFIPINGFSQQASLHPVALAFDGFNVWTANYGTGDVTKLSLRDARGRQTFTVHKKPSAIAYDGANIWVANFGSNDVTKLRASDGAILGTYPVGVGPSGIAFDGANVWVANSGDRESNLTHKDTVTKLRASDGLELGTYQVGDSPFGVAFDGANVWVTNSRSNNVTKLRASDGQRLGTYSVGSNPRGIAFDGSAMWVANYGSNNLTKLRASDGALLGTTPAQTGQSFVTGGSVTIGNLWGVAFDGFHVWASSSGTGYLIRQ
jgi:outer membrane lipoprotein-sorting protein